MPSPTHHRRGDVRQQLGVLGGNGAPVAARSRAGVTMPAPGQATEPAMQLGDAAGVPGTATVGPPIA